MRYKFRGKRKDNGEWIYGFYGEQDHGDFTKSFIMVSTMTFVPNTHVYFTDHEVDPATVGQLTGMLDKNGKEIFDGDIVKSQRGYSFVVEWTDDGRFLGRTANRSIAYVGQEPAVEIDGNIHDNPEMLVTK